MTHLHSRDKSRGGLESLVVAPCALWEKALVAKCCRRVIISTTLRIYVPRERSLRIRDIRLRIRRVDIGYALFVSPSPARVIMMFPSAVEMLVVPPSPILNETPNVRDRVGRSAAQR